MNEAQIRTVEQIRQVLEGTQALEFKAAADDGGRYALDRGGAQAAGLPAPEAGRPGAVLAYPQRLSGYSRAQVTRLVSRWMDGHSLTKNYRRPAHAFARRYTPADVALLAEVGRTMKTLSGPATVCVLRRARDVFSDARFECLGSNSVRQRLWRGKRLRLRGQLRGWCGSRRSGAPAPSPPNTMRAPRS